MLASRLVRLFANNAPQSHLQSIIARRKQQRNLLHNSFPRFQQFQLTDYLYQTIPYDFKIVAIPFSLSSQRVQTVLKLHQINFTAVQNPLYINRLKYRFKQIKKFTPQQKEVMLLVEFNLNEPQLYAGEENILQFFTKDYIKQYMHITYTGWESQGLEFVREKIGVQLNRLFWNPNLTFQSQFFNDNKLFKDKNMDGLTSVYLNFYLCMKTVLKNTPLILKHKQDYHQAKNRLVQGFSLWDQRLGKSPFHGGQNPDKADVQLFSYIKSRQLSRSFSNFMQKQSVWNWFKRMQMRCQFKY